MSDGPLHPFSFLLGPPPDAKGEKRLTKAVRRARRELRALDQLTAAMDVAAPEVGAVLADECQRACLAAAARFADIARRLREDPHALFQPVGKAKATAAPAEDDES
jgi:hypothetical protein